MEKNAIGDTGAAALQKLFHKLAGGLIDEIQCCIQRLMSTHSFFYFAHLCAGVGPQPGIVLQDGDIGAATGPFTLELFGNEFSSAAVNNMTAVFKRSWTRYKLVLHLCGTGDYLPVCILAIAVSLHEPLLERIIAVTHLSPFGISTTLAQDQETSTQKTVMNSEKPIDCEST